MTDSRLVAELPAPNTPITLEFLLPADFRLHHVLIWNYNRANCETIGVRKVGQQ